MAIFLLFSEFVACEHSGSKGQGNRREIIDSL